MILILHFDSETELVATVCEVWHILNQKLATQPDSSSSFSSSRWQFRALLHKTGSERHYTVSH